MKQLKLKIPILFIALFFSWLQSLQAQDSITPMRLGNQKLVMIKALDNERRTFIINLGFQDQIGKHQESLFSTDDVSIRAKAIEVSRYNSLWEVRNKNLALPFEAEQTVVYSKDLNDIWNDVTRTIAYEKSLEEAEKRRWTQDSYWTTRVSFTRAVSESITDTTADQDIKRGGYQVDLMYNVPILNPVDFGVGVRADFETAIQQGPNLEIPTNRFILMNEYTYNFNPLLNGDFFYISAGIGYGVTRTDVSGDINEGNTWVLPIGRLGYARMFAQNKALTIEGVVESLSSSEQTVIETEQRTTIINTKVSIGLRF